MECWDWRREIRDVIEMWSSWICVAFCKPNYKWEKRAELIKDKFYFFTFVTFDCYTWLHAQVYTHGIHKSGWSDRVMLWQLQSFFIVEMSHGLCLYFIAFSLCMSSALWIRVRCHVLPSSKLARNIARNNNNECVIHVQFVSSKGFAFDKYTLGFSEHFRL